MSAPVAVSFHASMCVAAACARNTDLYSLFVLNAALASDLRNVDSKDWRPVH